MTRRIAVQLVLTMLLLGLVLAPTALAKGGGKGGSPQNSPASSLALASEYIYWPSIWQPNCVTEDDSDVRNFSGSLNGSYSTSYRLCDLAVDGSTAGGEGFISTVAVVGSLNDMTITAPDGTVRHAVAMSQSSTRGVTTTNYAVCWCPPYFLANDNSTNPLAGGTWTITLSGQITRAAWSTAVEMTNVSQQQTYCPPAQQNVI